MKNAFNSDGTEAIRLSTLFPNPESQEYPLQAILAEIGQGKKPSLEIISCLSASVASTATNLVNLCLADLDKPTTKETRQQKTETLILIAEISSLITTLLSLSDK